MDSQNFLASRKRIGEKELLYFLKQNTCKAVVLPSSKQFVAVLLAVVWNEDIRPPDVS